MRSIYIAALLGAMMTDGPDHECLAGKLRLLPS
jgi:hypothetical protein